MQIQEKDTSPDAESEITVIDYKDKNHELNTEMVVTKKSMVDKDKYISITQTQDGEAGGKEMVHQAEWTPVAVYAPEFLDTELDVPQESVDL